MPFCSDQPPFHPFKNMLFASLTLFSALATQGDGSSYCLQGSKTHNNKQKINCLNISSSPSTLHDLSTNSSSMSSSSSFSIENPFTLPSSLPSWPPGGGFASGNIDLGGLLVSQVSSFTKVWATPNGGPDNSGATFFEPSSLPDGFFMLGSYAQANNVPLFGSVLVGKDVMGGALRKPTDYSLVWSSENHKEITPAGYIWLPVCPDGYEAVGYLLTTTPQKPPLDKIRCVCSNFTDASETNEWIWGADGVNVYSSRPQAQGIQAPGVPMGSFSLWTDSNSSSLPQPACLRNRNQNFSSAMPNLAQIKALMEAYSPVIFFHPDEAFFPSSVEWFFENGALLYTKGKESEPVGIDPNGANLPQGGSNDGSYWLDLPTGDADKEKLKKGNIQNASAYIHVKPMFAGTFTDIAVWLFYPFNGAAIAKVEFLTIPLGKIGEHVGDWEHVTLRISNFNGALTSVYFSQHARGVWESASQLEFKEGTNKPVVYSSKDGHAAYPKPGENLQGSGDIGIRNDTDSGGSVMDTGLSFTVVAGEGLGGKDVITEPLWLNYAREWGPKISYDIGKELKKLERFLPGKLKSELERIVRGLPSEVLGEEGPVGPKWKDNWSGDERSST
ncbi:unnamed protein product [Cuscuta epithymum]|uniref:Vacuolar protein sorting-associated protein 62 n=1 Tax=Cuscuta epithymum TaxID=186058 RepID=A0AAV0GJK0_9ASTE|nr:unnamed protein product [Cuscuta epithymum]